MNLYEIAVGVRGNYLKGNYQPGTGWLALKFTYRGELYQIANTLENNGKMTWEVYRTNKQGLGTLVLTL